MFRDSDILIDKLFICFFIDNGLIFCANMPSSAASLETAVWCFVDRKKNTIPRKDHNHGS